MPTQTAGPGSGAAGGAPDAARVLVGRRGACTRIAGALAAATGASGCALMPPARSVRGGGAPESYNVVDAKYGPAARQRIKVYKPSAPPPSGRQGWPVLVFWHGGGWQSGEIDHAENLVVARSLARRGVAVVLAGYRYWPEVSFPTFIEDGAAALAWTFGCSASLDLDRQRVFVGGHSAGGHIAAMLAVAPGYLGPHGIECRRIAGVIGIAGAYTERVPYNPFVSMAFAGLRDRGMAMPARHVTANAPPFLLLAGGLDLVGGAADARAFAERARAAGARVQDKVYPLLGHLSIVARHPWDDCPVADEIVAFIEAAPPAPPEAWPA